MPFAKGQSGNPAGQFTSENQPPNAAKTHEPQRSYVARQVLNLMVKVEATTLEELKKSYPQVTDNMTVEELGTLIQANKAILFQDTAALNSLLDSAYGRAGQKTEVTGEGGEPLVINFVRRPHA